MRTDKCGQQAIAQQQGRWQTTLLTFTLVLPLSGITKRR
jgi:hypothetical protein